MSDTPTELSDKLAREGQKSLEFFRAIPESNWTTRVYQDGARWDVQHVLIHLAETEEDIPRLMRSILSGGEGVAKGFDIDAYNSERVGSAQAATPEDWLARFAARRAETVAFVGGLTETDLQQRGRHPFLGETEIVEMIRLMYLHVQMHQRDVKRALHGG
ncbi:MAG: DinB family protein [Chloroflexi bacterium]|nr:DinB family protein [Chloroflexota bacterium]